MVAFRGGMPLGSLVTGLVVDRPAPRPPSRSTACSCRCWPLVVLAPLPQPRRGIADHCPLTLPGSMGSTLPPLPWCSTFAFILPHSRRSVDLAPSCVAGLVYAERGAGAIDPARGARGRTRREGQGADACRAGQTREEAAWIENDRSSSTRLFEPYEGWYVHFGGLTKGRRPRRGARLQELVPRRAARSSIPGSSASVRNYWCLHHRADLSQDCRRRLGRWRPWLSTATGRASGSTGSARTRQATSRTTFLREG